MNRNRPEAQSADSRSRPVFRTDLDIVLSVISIVFIVGFVLFVNLK